MKAPGMHCSGPRPKSHPGAFVSTSSETFCGCPQVRCAEPSGELPAGWQLRARISAFRPGVFWLMKLTARSPLGCTTRSECPSRLHDPGSRSGLNALPSPQTDPLMPLICSGVDQVNPWSVDIEPQIGDSQYSSWFLPQLKSNTVQVK